MEQKLENIIDNGLESISQYLYMASIILGAILILLGIFLIINKRGESNRNALICIIIGSVALISGIVQR